MNDTLLLMKQMRRAMRPYVLMLYEMIYEMKPDLVLEIGVRQAQSTRVILSALTDNKKGKLVSIDRRDRSDRIPEPLKKYWLPIIGNSHARETYKKAKDYMNEYRSAYALFLIDGDHSYEGAKKDFNMYGPMIDKNGFILLHDTINPNEEVKKLWEEIKMPKINLSYGFAGMGIVKPTFKRVIRF